jgi:hypothetical protein
MNEPTLSAVAVISGTPEHTVLRVKRLAGQWIVENYFGVCVGEASERDAAIALARQACDTCEASLIAVLSEKGDMETILDV